MNERSLTTKEIAQYCHVTQRTAVQWISEGKLKFFRTPGKHIRVYQDDFLKFLKEYQMPIPEELAETVQSNGKKRILIVDDDKGVVDSIQRTLRLEDKYILETAYDGFETGRKFSAFKPHLIVLDLNMPGINGYEVCARIRSESKNDDVKILVISGVINKEEVEHIKNLGADDYLSKPFGQQELKIKIAGLLGWNKRSEDRE